MKKVKIPVFLIFIFMLVTISSGCKKDKKYIYIGSSGSAPVISSILDQNATEASPFVLDLTPYVSDEDAVGDLTFSVVSGGGSFSSPVYSNTFMTTGTTTVTFSVMDTDSMSATGSFNVIVAEMANSSPVILAIPEQIAVTGYEFSLDLAPYVTDDHDQDSQLQFSLTSAEGVFTGSMFANTFATEATHTVSFSVTDTRGEVSNSSFDVVVSNTVMADFYASVLIGEAPLTVDFMDISVGVVTSWVWDFDSDGTPDSGLQNPSHTYDSPGCYTVTLEVAGPSGGDTETRHGYIIVGNNIWHVDSLSSSGNGTTWSQAFEFIQEGLDAADDMDIVLVADGTYTGATNRALDFGGKDIMLTVFDLYASSEWIVDCEHLGRAFMFDDGESSDAVVKGFTINNGAGAGQGGGGIYCHNNSSPTIIDSEIYNCTANMKGGGIFILDSAPSILNSRIIGCTAVNSGGAVFCENSNYAYFIDCLVYGSFAQVGGGFCVINCAPSISGCTIESNDAATYGGGMFITNNANPEILECIIHDNTNSTGSGGGIYSSNLSSPLVSNCIVTSNYAIFGGGYYVDGGSPLIVECSFDLNSSGSGGSFLFFATDTAYVVDCAVKNSRAYYGGGAFRADVNAIVEITGTTFDSCYAASTGGCMYSSGGAVTFIDSTIQSCSSPYAGAIYASGSDIYLTDSDLLLNSATAGDGGAVYSDGAVLTFNGLTFTSNSASGDGGAIFANSSSLVSLADSTFAQCSAASGGALYLDSVSNAALNDSIVINCSVTDEGGGVCMYDVSNMQILNSQIISCTADGEGGGLYLNNTDGSVEGSTVTSNFSSLDGGGAFLDNQSDTFLNLTTFSYNTAGQNGGGICTDAGSNPTIDECTILHNTATLANGGGLLLHIYYDTISNCTIEDNTAVAGAGIYTIDSNFTICTTSISSNQASGNGGGIGSGTANSSSTIYDCIIIGNQASASGGGINASFLAGTISNSIISGNIATATGGGVYNTDLKLYLTNCLVSDNQAVTGGGLYFGTGNNVNYSSCTIAGNSATEGGGCYLADTTGVVMLNSIIFGNSASAAGNQVCTASVTSALDLGYSLVPSSAIDSGRFSGSGTINLNTGTLEDNPLFATAASGNYFLSQTAAGQGSDSPCVDAGSDTAASLGLGAKTTRTDLSVDTGTADMGYHYPLTP